MSAPRVSLKNESSVITKGTTPTSLGHAFTDSGVPFIRAQNLVDGSVSVAADPLFISPATNDALKRSKIKADDLLISIAGTIGRAAIVPSDAKEMNCNQAVAIVRPSDNIDRRFLLHWLSSNDALSQMARGKVTGVISNLSLGEIGKLEIPLPPLEEQTRIAGILDQADALRRLRTRALEKLNTLGQAIFHEMFGDPIANDKKNQLVSVADVISGFDTGKSLAEDPNTTQNNGYRVLKISAVTSGIFKPEESKPLPSSYIPPDGHIVNDGDLLFSRANTAQLIGATAFVRTETAKLVLPDKLWRFVWKSETKVLPEFIEALFSSPTFREEITKRASGTSGSMKNIGKQKVMTISFGLPTLVAQQEFLRRREIANQQITHFSFLLSRSETLFASLQHRAFRGEL